jgi:protein-tyrosine-phosphatase
MTLGKLPGLTDPDHELHSIAQDLARKYDGVVSAEVVERTVFESYAALARTARITAHLPALTAHFASERLAALASATGARPSEVPEVLFVCIQNAERSQMAAALLNDRAGGRVHARSAGTMPAAGVHPNAVTALAEVGVDMSHGFPKPLTDDVIRAADVVITMGSEGAVPVYRGRRYEEWSIADPADESLAEARRIRDEVEARISRLLTDLAPAD